MGEWNEEARHLGHERPLQPGGEASAATAAQSRSLHVGDDLQRWGRSLSFTTDHTLALSLAASQPRSLTRSPSPSPSLPPSHSPSTPLPLPPLSHSRAPPGSRRAGGRHKLPRRHPGPQAMRALMRRLPARGREGRSPWSCTYAGEVCGRRDEGGHEVVREAAVAVVVVVVGWGVEVWVGGGGHQSPRFIAPWMPQSVSLYLHTCAGGEGAFCGRRHRGGHSVQVSEDAVPILQVALVGASLPHGEGAGSTRERRRAAGDWPQPHRCSTPAEHHGDR